MKNAAILVAILCMFLNVHAYTINSIPNRVSNIPHHVKGPTGKVGLDGKPAEKVDAIKKARAKKVSVEKLEIPDGAIIGGYPYPIHNKNRIDSLCGYELGQVVKVPVRPTLDDNGNILITQRLKKPFRKCTQVTLCYSKINHALYGIKLFSEGDKKMSEAEAWQELETMADAIKAKFGDRIGLVSNMKVLMKIDVSGGLYSAQHFSLSARKVDLVKKSSMKGATPDKGWVFTAFLVDQAMHDYDPEYSPAAPAAQPEDIDAL